MLSFAWSNKFLVFCFNGTLQEIVRGAEERQVRRRTSPDEDSGSEVHLLLFIRWCLLLQVCPIFVVFEFYFNKKFLDTLFWLGYLVATLFVSVFCLCACISMIKCLISTAP